VNPESERQANLNARFDALRQEVNALMPGARQLTMLPDRVTPDEIANQAVSRELLERCVPKKPYRVQCPDCWGIAWFQAADGLVACETCGGAGRIAIVERIVPRRFALRDKIVMWAAAAALLAAAVWISLR
jgi:ribosomal protein S27E